jgi:hypothetical protein
MFLEWCGDDLCQRNAIGLAAQKADRSMHAMQSGDLGFETECLFARFRVMAAVLDMTEVEVAWHMVERRHGLQATAHFRYRKGHMQQLGPSLVGAQPLMRRLLYWLVPDLRRLDQEWRAMMVQHAKDRAALAAWEAECWRYLAQGPDTPYLPPPETAPHEFVN